MDIQHQQIQTEQLNQYLLQSLTLLQMNAAELDEYLLSLSQENPVIDLPENNKQEPAAGDDSLISKLEWLENTDRQNRFYNHVESEELDPLFRVGTAGGLEETLSQFLNRQLARIPLKAEVRLSVQILIECLDGDGYFRDSIGELAEISSFPVELLQQGMAVLHMLEPAGVGAKDLPECLCLQLQRIGKSDIAEEVAQNHLEDLAKGRYQHIAQRLHITPEEVVDVLRVIRELEPRPGAVFQHDEQIPYIIPDVYVEDDREGSLRTRLRAAEAVPFHISPYYQKLLSENPDQEVREYLTAKINQAKSVLQAIERRKSTLLRCAEFIVANQEQFFRHGPEKLYQLRMTDAAQKLELHISTISRAVRGKYLQCRWGIFPLSYFFSRNAALQTDGGVVLGVQSAQVLLRQLIEKEDKGAPLSDQKLSEEMERLGCPISRRTVAKYREEMNIPGTYGRKNRERL